MTGIFSFSHIFSTISKTNFIIVAKIELSPAKLMNAIERVLIFVVNQSIHTLLNNPTRNIVAASAHIHVFSRVSFVSTPQSILLSKPN